MPRPTRANPPIIRAFDLAPGRMLAGKYRVILKLGAGWEGEVYKVAEARSGIERAAKLFYPRRNPNNRTAVRYAQKLHKLRDCPIVIQYHTEEMITFRRTPITMLVSEYVPGLLLSEFLARQPGKRLRAFEAVHLLYALAKGLETIHAEGEYHGDLHDENVIVCHFGLGFKLKLLDFFHWKASKRENRQDDLCGVIRVFYDALGGAKHYRRQPPVVKHICRGLKRSLILSRFRTMTGLRQHLETMTW